jgi:serine/threonine protein kinase
MVPPISRHSPVWRSGAIRLAQAQLAAASLNQPRHALLLAAVAGRAGARAIDHLLSFAECDERRVLARFGPLYDLIVTIHRRLADLAAKAGKLGLAGRHRRLAYLTAERGKGRHATVLPVPLAFQPTVDEQTHAKLELPRQVAAALEGRPAGGADGANRLKGKGTTMPTPLSYQVGERIGGRYEVEETVAGGMGEVYLCRDHDSSTWVALKTIQTGLASQPALRAAFEEEVSYWVSLERHRNIVQCFYLEEFNGRLFLVLESIYGDKRHGASLLGWLHEGPLPPRRAVEIALDICRGLTHVAYKRPGLVHRDLKPGNILVEHDGIAKITDFGLATLVAAPMPQLAADVPAGRPTMVQEGGAAGTPEYMAPEQLRCEPLDGRTDLYAVGCILYEMLTGRPPYGYRRRPADEDGYLRRQHLEAPLPSLAMVADLPPDLGALVMRCLAKDKRERSSSADLLFGKLDLLYRRAWGERPPWRSPAPGPSVTDYHNWSSTLGRLGQNDESLAAIERASKEDSEDPDLWYSKGVTLQGLGRYAEALAANEQAIALRPDYADAWHNKGIALAHLDRHAEALAALERAIALEPANMESWQRKSSALTQLGRYAEALAANEQAIALFDDKDNHLWRHPNETLAVRRRNQKELAENERAIELDPANPGLWSSNGFALSNLGRHC